MGNNLYFDEAGDLTLFDKKKRAIPLGANGVSRYFALGVAVISENSSLAPQLMKLRSDLLADPLLKNIPSMEKTKRFFHAKDDHIAVKRDVFRLLEENDFAIYIAVIDKIALQKQAREEFIAGFGKMTQTSIYMKLVSHIFENNLPLDLKSKLYFSYRSKTTENTALSKVIQSSGINNEINCCHPSEHIGLQVVDYCLWAFQRFHERGEDYYYNRIATKFIKITGELGSL
jgi:hypothetical protein